MNNTNLALPDQRMLQLMEYAVKNDIAANETDYWSKIGFARTNISNIKKGTQGFTRDQITSACQLTGASADWVLGLDKTMFRERKVKSALQMLKEATAQLEQQLKARSRLSKLLL